MSVLCEVGKKVGHGCVLYKLYGLVTRGLMLYTFCQRCQIRMRDGSLVSCESQIEMLSIKTGKTDICSQSLQC